MVLVATLAACGGPLLVWHGHGPDRAHRAELLEQGGVQRMIVDGEAGPPVAAVGLAQLRWSTRGVVYPARVGERWRVIVGREPGPAHDAIGEIAVAGDRVAYAALDGDTWRVVVGGEAGPPFTSLRSGTLRFFRDGRRVVYVGRAADGERAVIDGAAGPAFDRVGMLSIGAKGALVGYVGFTEAGASVVIDGEVVLRAEDVGALELASAEPRFAALVTMHGAPAVVHDGDVVARPADATQLAISAEGAHVAWVARTEDTEEVWLDGSRAGAHEAIEALRFVPRTGALLYVARDGERARVVHAGEAGPHAAAIESLVTSPAGHFGYVARRGAGRFVVVDGVVRHRGEWAGALVLAERSDRFAFVARRAGVRWVVTPDGRIEVPRPFVDTLVLDPSGRRWAIAVADRRTRRIEVLVDGRSVAVLDADEVAAAITQGRDPAEAVRAIVAGELARAIAER